MDSKKMEAAMRKAAEESSHYYIIGDKKWYHEDYVAELEAKARQEGYKDALEAARQQSRRVRDFNTPVHVFEAIPLTALESELDNTKGKE